MNSRITLNSRSFDTKIIMSNTRMARSTDPLVVGRVVGDVLDPFVPSVDMAVYYGSRQVTNGCDFKPSATFQPPVVQIAGCYEDGSLFTLIMTDPDAPSPSEPTMREWVHWIVSDIPGATDVTKGREMVPYAPPKPPIGIHRYIFTLFKQRGPMFMASPSVRQNFSTRVFSHELGLGSPVAAVYFNSQKEASSKRR